MDGLGRVNNVVPVAAGVWINVQDCSGVQFVCTNASGDTYTLLEAKDASGTGSKSPVALNITRYYTGPVSGTAAWVEHVIPAANTTGAIGGSGVLAVAVFDVDVKGIDPLFHYIKVTATGSGTVVAIPHDLQVQRSPQNLVALGV